MPKFPSYKQTESKDCGPSCIKIIAKHYGKLLSIEKLRTYCETTRQGSNLRTLSEAAELIGFRTLGVKIALEKLTKVHVPCIVHWNKSHYVVVYEIKTKKNGQLIIYVSDPAFGLISYTEKEFLTSWIGNNADRNTEEGIALLLEPTPKFYSDTEANDTASFDLKFVFKYVNKYKKFIAQIFLGVLAGSILQLIAPFLTQSIVDIGIKHQNINFIYLVLIAMLALFIGRTFIQILRSWIILHLSTRINIALISDFFIKLMNLPIAYFDVKMTGDLLQRIRDHKRLENILTLSSLNTIFSIVNIIVFSSILVYYNILIFLIFLLGSILYIGWIYLFFSKRRKLNYKRFTQLSEEQSKILELVNGMQEIKLHNAEKKKRWNWEFIQAKLFKTSVKHLALEQYQEVGASFINEFQNILITVCSAKLVIDGEITLGMMVAINTIVGQLNIPIKQLIDFLRELQDVQIALERLSEIHNKEDESTFNESKIRNIPINAGFVIEKLKFRYTGAENAVLEDVSFTIPPNKITAIVGVSGSGKTTLMKLLLKYYTPTEGQIKVGKHYLNNIAQKAWRDQFGVVMQDGYIFNDTIANNIALGVDHIDHEKLMNAVDTANIQDFIESLPLSYNTKIGMEGMGLSTGQKQRLLIARAIYKNPKFLFLDEATSALDANNENKIMKKLNTFFKDKTVIIIAHRLSTVKNADQIVVLDQKKAAEIGDHHTLTLKKGLYYELVKNQLELGA